MNHPHLVTDRHEAMRFIEAEFQLGEDLDHLLNCLELTSVDQLSDPMLCDLVTDWLEQHKAA